MGHTVHADEKREALDEALELIEQLKDALDAAGLMSDERFRAYHVSELEGEQHGWLGGPFLVDAIREAIDDLDEDDEDDEELGDCPTCGGIGTRCPDPEHHDA